MDRKDQIRLEGAFEKSARFLESLGLTVRQGPAAGGFLSGIAIEYGELVVESAADEIASPLLHEAGHLAVLPGMFRAKACGDLAGVIEQMGAWLDEHMGRLDLDDPSIRAILQCGECEATAWSFAAAHAAGLDTRIPFIRGFEGDGLMLHDQIAAGCYFGVHGLAAGGMTDLPRPRSAVPFPLMKRWLQV